MKKQLQDSIQEAIQKGWADLSSTYGSVEEQVVRRFKQARKKVEPPHTAEEIQALLADFGRRLHESSQSVEKRVEHNVRTAADKVRGPLMDELASLRARAEKLSHRIESQLRDRKPPEDGDGDQ